MAVTNDFAPANAGQLKNMAWQAYEEMQATLPGGAGEGTSNMVFSLTPGGDFSPVNIGQLKYVAQPFYSNLIAVGCANAYPWAGVSATNDFAPANIGQLKNLFSFDPGRDSDNDGLPDWWEVQHGLDPFDDGTTNVDNGAGGDPDGDGFENELEFELGAPPDNPAWNGQELAYRLTHAHAIIVTNTRSIITNMIGMRVDIEDSENCGGSNSTTQNVVDVVSVSNLLECGYYVDITVKGAVEDRNDYYDQVHIEAYTNTYYFEGSENYNDCKMVTNTITRNVFVLPNSDVALRYNTMSYKHHVGAYAEIISATIAGVLKIDIEPDCDKLPAGSLLTVHAMTSPVNQPVEWSVTAGANAAAIVQTNATSVQVAAGRPSDDVDVVIQACVAGLACGASTTITIIAECDINSTVSPLLTSLGSNNPSHPNCDGNPGLTSPAVDPNDPTRPHAIYGSTPCMTGGVWFARMTETQVAYYLQICNLQSLPVLADASDPVVTETNYCAILTELTLHPNAMSEIFPETCVRAHEEAHVAELEDTANQLWSAYELAIEQLSVAFDCGSAATREQAQAALAPYVDALYIDFLIATYTLWPMSHDPNDPPVSADRACRDALVVAIQNRAITEGWAPCP